METSKSLIYATRSLPQEEQEKIKNAGLDYAEEDFIEVAHNYDSEQFWEALLHSPTQARIFTSKNAVYSLEKLTNDQAPELPPKKTFTVGIRATERLEALGMYTAARALNAISLAQIIARNAEVRAVDFFCGNQSLQDLPEYLESKNIEVFQHEVYQTELRVQKIDTSPIRGIIFLSPTAVYSFFKKNTLDPEIPCFCIGATTAEAVHLRCDNPQYLADEPSLSSVVDRVVEFFHQAETSI